MAYAVANMAAGRSRISDDDRDAMVIDALKKEAAKLRTEISVCRKEKYQLRRAEKRMNERIKVLKQEVKDAFQNGKDAAFDSGTLTPFDVLKPRQQRRRLASLRKIIQKALQLQLSMDTATSEELSGTLVDACKAKLKMSLPDDEKELDDEKQGAIMEESEAQRKQDEEKEKKRKTLQTLYACTDS